MPEAHLLAGPQLRHRVERGPRDDRDHRVAAGDGAVGEQDRRAVRRPRPASIRARSPRSRARPRERRSSAGPTSRAPMRSACSVSRHRDSKSASRAASVNQSARGPGRSASVTRAGRRRERDVLVDDGHGCRGLRADREHPARDHGLGSERRRACPATASRARPAPRCRRARRAGSGCRAGRHADLEHGAVAGPRRGVRRDTACPSRLDRSPRAGDREPRVALEPGPEPADEELERGGAVGIADEPVRERERAAVERAGSPRRRGARGPVARGPRRAPTRRAARRGAGSSRADRLEAHASARREQRRLVGVGVPQPRIRAADEAPAARALTAGRRRRTPRRARRRPRARECAARRGGAPRTASRRSRGSRSPGANPMNATRHSIDECRATSASVETPSSAAVAARSSPS